MNTNKRVLLTNSSNTVPKDSTTVPADLGQIATAVMLLRRQQFDGLSMQQHADAIIAGKRSDTLSYSEFAQRYSSSAEDLEHAVGFARYFGLTVIESSAAAAMVKVRGTVKQLNTAFQTQLLTIESNGKTWMGYDGILTIPESLYQVVEYVIGLNNPATMRHLLTKPKQPTAAVSASAGLASLTPIQVAAAYNFPASSGYGQCIGLIEYGGGYTAQNITSSFSAIGLSNPQVVSIPVDTGTNDPSDADSSGEVMLDIFIAGAVVPHAKIAVYFGAGAGNPLPGPNWYDPINTAIHDRVNAPCVLSISWGESEAAFGRVNMQAMDMVLSQAALLGITVCAASGDSGSTWDGLGVEVLYPASSPYVLSCGGTSLLLNGSAIASEVVWNQSRAQAGATGGGISIYESKPPYQTGLTYKLYPSNTVTSLATRGVPDVAGNADPFSGYSFYYSNRNLAASQVGGTSAVAPLWAGLIARLVCLTGKNLGLVNTLLYSSPAVFNDVISGQNVYTPSSVTTGYSATTGWDACTGLGSPNGTKILLLIRKGPVWPKNNYGFRPSSGAVWPRTNTGVRQV